MTDEYSNTIYNIHSLNILRYPSARRRGARGATQLLHLNLAACSIADAEPPRDGWIMLDISYTLMVIHGDD